MKQSDLILTMERRHKEEIVQHFPHVQPRVHLLGDFVKLDVMEAEVADPIGRSEDFYRTVFSKIQDAIQKLGELL